MATGTFESSNPEIASVTQDGLITANAVGTANVYHKNSEGVYDGKIGIDCVAPEDSTEPTGITLNKTSVKLKYAYDFSKQLKATVTPATATNKAVTWTSSNPNLLTCVNGYLKVTENGGGNVTVTASTVNGITATCVVTITPNGTVVNSITPNVWNVASSDSEEKTFDIDTTDVDGYNSGYTVYDSAGYTRVVSRSDSSFKLRVSKNNGADRDFSVYVHGNFSGDTAKVITVHQPHNEDVISFGNSSLHRTYGYDKDGDKIVTGSTVDTTYFLADQNSSVAGWGNSFHHMYDDDGNLISGGAIIYITCIPSALESIIRRTTISDPWIRISYYEHRSGIGGMVGIIVQKNTTGVKREGYVKFPGSSTDSPNGFSYPIVQEA